MPLLNSDSHSFQSERELREERAKAKKRFRLWRRRALFANVALLVSFGAVYPFITGNNHSPREEAEKHILLLAALAMVFLALYVNVLFWAAWRVQADVEVGQVG